MITHDALGLDYSFDEKDHKFIQREKQKKNQEQKREISEINEFDDVELFPPLKRSKQSGGSTVTKKVTTFENVKRKKEVKFMWTSHRKLMLVECVIDTTFFEGDPKHHDDIAKTILLELQEEDSVFDKVDYKRIKKQLYSIQHEVVEIRDETQLTSVRLYVQNLYKHFKEKNISLENRLYVKDSDGMYFVKVFL